jgi:hypothetical protein
MAGMCHRTQLLLEMDGHTNFLPWLASNCDPDDFSLEY